MRRHLRIFFIAALFAPAYAAATETSQPPVLSAMPRCVKERLGHVEVHLGNKDPDDHGAMPPPAIGYKRAFDQLQREAMKRGANAVVLRNHEAAFVMKGGRRITRPSYVSLHGAAVIIDSQACELAVIDPVEFERDVLKRDRENVTKRGAQAL